jgi:hypothetical protein
MSPYKSKHDPGSPKNDVPMIASNDQVKMILKGLGKQNLDTDLSFVTSEYAIKYIEDLEATINREKQAHLPSQLAILRKNIKSESYADIV